MLALDGRADGIITSEEGVTIDEIKCMYTDVTRFEEPIFVHKAQAMCYAYIYALQNGLDQISVQMTYCDLDTEEIRRFQESFSFFWLERWFQDMIEAYRKWTDFQFAWRKIRQASIQTLEFRQMPSVWDLAGMPTGEPRWADIADTHSVQPHTRSSSQMLPLRTAPGLKP